MNPKWVLSYSDCLLHLWQKKLGLEDHINAFGKSYVTMEGWHHLLSDSEHHVSDWNCLIVYWFRPLYGIQTFSLWPLPKQSLEYRSQLMPSFQGNNACIYGSSLVLQGLRQSTVVLIWFQWKMQVAVGIKWRMVLGLSVHKKFLLLLKAG